jgi:hypothetical protein
LFFSYGHRFYLDFSVYCFCLANFFCSQSHGSIRVV